MAIGHMFAPSEAKKLNHPIEPKIITSGLYLPNIDLISKKKKKKARNISAATIYAFKILKHSLSYERLIARMPNVHRLGHGSSTNMVSNRH